MPATPDTPRQSTILAFDFGHRRIGIAVGQDVTGSATALGAVGNGERGPDWAALDALIAEWRPDRLVVGLPLNADGSPSQLAADARDFCTALARFRRPVATVDERYSSLEARERLRRERRAGLKGRVGKEAVDAAAAVEIAERWLADRAAGRDPGISAADSE